MYRCGGQGLLRSPGPDLRRAQSGLAPDSRDRRCFGAPRIGPVWHEARHPLPDSLHQGSRRCLQAQRALEADYGRLLDPSLHAHLAVPADRHPYGIDDDHDRRLSEARCTADAVLCGNTPAGRGLPVYYTEFGVQTRVPVAHRQAYEDLNSPGSADAVDPQTQARYYDQALALAACQPTVKGLFIFHTFDE